MIDFGIVRPGTTLYIPFASYAGSTGASATLTGLATTDIEVYKDGGTTQRASDSGYALLDTDGIDFDGTTGIHGFSIDLADNTTAGFYASGSQYFVVISSVTIDSQTVNFIAARFTIGYPSAILNTTIATLSSQTSFTLTAGPAEDDALNGMELLIHDVASAVQVGRAVVSDYTGSTKTVTLAAGTTFTAAAGDNVAVLGLSPLIPTVSGRTLDVSGTGEAGVDWGNVGSPTTTLNLSGTTIKTATDVETDTADIQGRVPSSTAATNLTVVFDTDFAANYNTTADKWKVDVTHSAGVQVYASDFTVASATASTVTLPTTDSAGTAIPDDDRYVYGVLRVVAGTGIGQVVLLTTAAASARQYNILSGTCPVQLDNTSECVVEGAWQSNLAHINGAAVSTSTAQLGVNVVNFGGSAGTFSSGRPEVNASHLGGSTTPITNMTTVFSTDFAANYNTTDDKWVVKLGDGTVHGGTTAVGQFNTFTVGGDSLATMDGSGRVSANVTAISDDATAAANLEAYTDGTTYMPVDAHKQNWTVVDADTISVKGPDGTTEAYTKTVTTSGTADPITGSTLD